MEDLADTLTASAQNLMNSYNQMAANVVAMEKNVEAAQSSYDAAVKKRSAGLIKDTELESEKSSLERQQLPGLLVMDGCIYVSANIEGPGALVQQGAAE